MPNHQHHQHARHNLRVGVITASDTRTLADDKSGALIRELFEAAGHRVEHYEVLPDEPKRIVAAIEAKLDKLDAIVITGGTGIARRDLTVEAVRPLLAKELEGFGELFRMLSFQEVGSAAMLSRALAGVRDRTFIAVLPGSTGAVRLAMEKLILPELGHVAALLA